MVESDEKVVEKLADCIVRRIEPSIKTIVQRTVQEEVVAALKRALADSDFYKGLSDDVVTGIGKIYKEIFSMKQELQIDKNLLQGTFETIGESQSILDSVLSITETSTLNIMDIIELIQDKIEEIQNTIGELKDSGRVKVILGQINRKLLEILTLLGFQDVTGQKIRKLIASLKNIEEITLELYLASEILKRAKTEGFERSYEELREEVKKQIELMKSKKLEIVDQNTIDELLESLNL
ncbi:MAG: protein phosphatase CheZ [Thermodesulforhabdaceae bacterium]